MTNEPNITAEMLAAAWRAWKERHQGKLGPGPAFKEAIAAALAVQPREGKAAGETRNNAIGVGMVIAAGIIESALGQTTGAKEILGAAGVRSIEEAKKIGVDDYDIRLLKDVFKDMES